MNTFIITFIFFGAFILFMAVGVMIKGKRISGSCGGLNGLKMDDNGEQVCGVCGIPADQMKAKIATNV